MSEKKDLETEAEKAESVERPASLSVVDDCDITEEEAKARILKAFEALELADDETEDISGGSNSTLRFGSRVKLINSGHNYGSTKCTDPKCDNSTFYILKEVRNWTYLIQCTKCGWSYLANEINISV